MQSKVINIKTRNLLDSEKVYNICKNSPKEVFDFYYNNSDFELSGNVNYEDDKEYIQILISMLDEKKIDKEKIKKYVYLDYLKDAIDSDEEQEIKQNQE